MNKQIRTILPVNRVEGDLQIHLTARENIVRDAKSEGSMFRGIENVMTGRGPMDGLVITPRICGICTTAHLNSAAKALDMAFGASVPDNGIRIRNVTLMVEHLQNDIRHSFFLFMPDAANRAYAKHALFAEANERYEPWRGGATLQAVQETKKILEIIAILGGQWPHSSFMVPGGVVSVPTASDITTSRNLLKNFRSWYEQRVLGCSVNRWLEVQSLSGLDKWLYENRTHTESELGFFIRFCRSVGLEKIGKGHGNFICFGSFELPQNTRVLSGSQGRFLIPSGFFKDGKVHTLNPDEITEDISFSWLSGGRAPRHPFEGKTVSGGGKRNGDCYTWAKAPRYNKMPAETGPLAEALVSESPLFMDIIQKDGPSVFARQLARMARPAYLLDVMDQWLGEIISSRSDYFEGYQKKDACRGFGLIQAPRGALGHWVIIERGKIKNYQVITPTAWNASPRDSEKVRGPMEEAISGAKIKDMDNPVEIEHIIRSFDPCLVCTVH